MRLASINLGGIETAAIDMGKRVLPVSTLNRLFKTNWPDTIWNILQSGRLKELNLWFGRLNESDKEKVAKNALNRNEVIFAPLYRRPGKIWGIGLNYRLHAVDLSAQLPQELPASFIKSNTTIIGHEDTIMLPELSHKVTGEAELGLIIGREIKHIDPDNPLEALAGFTPIIDMTAEDILQKNPRYLTLSKNFDTFFSFGPQLVTPDEIPDLEKLRIATVLNGKTAAENTVERMTFSPSFLVRFHAQVMTMQPGDIISSGTPGAIALQEGDRIECRIDGFEPLINPVKNI